MSLQPPQRARAGLPLPGVNEPAKAKSDKAKAKAKAKAKTAKSARAKAKTDIPKRHHLDKRASQLAAVPGSDDDLLDTDEMAAWFGMSKEWLEIARSRGYGPPFVPIAPRAIRYRRGPVREWLNGRTYNSTSEYEKGPTTNAETRPHKERTKTDADQAKSKPIKGAPTRRGPPAIRE